jgi:hypothetical protein
MSVGAFLGIRPSFTNEPAANAFLQAIARALRGAELPAYHEPVEATARARTGRFGRSSFDHHSAAALTGLARRAVGSDIGRQLQLIGNNPHRAAFLPIDFPSPLQTDYVDPIAGNRTPIRAGSAYGLKRDLLALAPDLGIPLEGDGVSDEVAEQIDAGQSLDDSDYGPAWDDERTAWLLLFEGARLAIAHHTAFSLAG